MISKPFSNLVFVSFLLVLLPVALRTCLETGFGLGLAITTDDSNLVYGWGGAVGTYFRIDPKKELIYILMIQLLPYQQMNLRTLFQNYVNGAVNYHEWIKSTGL